MKSRHRKVWISLPESHPTRGAWIEISLPVLAASVPQSRTPHGVRGLKSPEEQTPSYLNQSRTPHGVRGLKFGCDCCIEAVDLVAPHTGCVD